MAHATTKMMMLPEFITLAQHLQAEADVHGVKLPVILTQDPQTQTWIAEITTKRLTPRLPAKLKAERRRTPEAAGPHASLSSPTSDGVHGETA
jgi:hypothetical protein